MRKFANLFLILFLADGALSVADELLSGLLQADFLSGLRNLVASLVVLLAVPLYISLGIDQRLPKRVFLPLTLFAFWGALELWPLAGVLGRHFLGPAAAAGQLLMGIAAFGWLRRSGGRPLLTAESFSAPLFSRRNTLFFFGANLLLLPLAAVFAGLALADSFLYRQTAGFMRISPLGIYMTERVYRRDDQTVRLLAMMHVGRSEFYEKVAASVGNGRTVILAEGVTDKNGLLKHRFDYGRIGEILGLVSQEEMRFGGRLIEMEDLDAGRGGEEPDVPHVVRADVDLSEFDPATVEFLNVVGASFFSGAGNGRQTYEAWIEEKMTPELMETIFRDILHKRNAEVIERLEQALGRYETIVIPWGAMHMPALHQAVMEEGFSLAESRERLSLDFRQIPYRRLLGQPDRERSGRKAPRRTGPSQSSFLHLPSPLRGGSGWGNARGPVPAAPPASPPQVGRPAGGPAAEPAGGPAGGRGPARSSVAASLLPASRGQRRRTGGSSPPAGGRERSPGHPWVPSAAPPAGDRGRGTARRRPLSVPPPRWRPPGGRSRGRSAALPPRLLPG